MFDSVLIMEIKLNWIELETALGDLGCERSKGKTTLYAFERVERMNEQLLQKCKSYIVTCHDTIVKYNVATF